MSQRSHGFVPAERAEDMMIPASDEKVAHLAVIEAVRALGSQVGRVAESVTVLAEKQDQTNDKLNRVHTDVAVMRQLNDRMDRLERDHESCKTAHEIRIKDLEMNDAKLAGAANGFEILRQWAPVIITVAIAIFTMVKTGALH